MAYQLSAQVTFCVTNDRVVFRDLKSGAYLSLERPESALFLAFAANGDSGRSHLIDGLVSVGILTETQSEFVPIVPVVLLAPDKSVFDDPVCRIPTHHVVEAILHQCWSAYLLQTRPLSSVINHLSKISVHTELPEDQRRAGVIERASRAFGISERFVPSSKQCLRRSIALYGYLARRAVRPRLVLGVKLNSFGAHAWVQHETTILNDSVENVLRYTPVMVV